MTHNYAKLPTAAMQDVGPAAQTLGGILLLTLKETYASTAKIAESTWLPVDTVRNHLTSLEERGWIENAGRQKTRGGRARRTCTIRTTPKTVEAVKSYCPQFWWVCRAPFARQWCAKALFAAVARRWLELRAGIIETVGPKDEFSLPGYLQAIGGDKRFGFSLNTLEEMTGLSRDSIVTGKRVLQRSGFIHLMQGETPHSPDLLLPNWNLKVIEESVGPGRCRLHFEPK